ncbi:MAG: hypothetical protein ABIN01_19545 [Ferruginibacter sp.]
MTSIKQGIPGETPDKPEEVPLPEKAPEVIPPVVPENPPLPPDNPDIFPDVEPFQPDIPTEVPPPQA